MSSVQRVGLDDGDRGAPPPERAAVRPLVLDLDRTLLATDLLHETLATALRRNPLTAIQAVGWLAHGRANLKQRLAAAADLDLENLPINEPLAAWAAEEKARTGRLVLIATAADRDLARRIAARFGFVDGVVGSDGRVNLKGAVKAQALADLFPDGFDYAGDSAADLAVWRVASGAILVGAGRKVEAAARAIREPVAVFPGPSFGLKDLLKAVRLHQWAKNALVFVPLILGGQSANPAAWAAAMLGFLALGLVASATYLLNDLWDLSDDRRHWTKRNRPLASGRMPIPFALALMPLGLLFGLSLAVFAGWPAAAVTAGYLALTLAYSFRLKREPIVDAVTLGGLFTLRLGLGVALAGVKLSPWLLVFAMFLFTSLALAKRHVELGRLARHGRSHAAGRGYRQDDGPVVLGMGLASGFVAVAVMVLYLIHEAFGQGFYAAPGWLWAFPLMLTLWIGRVWLLTGRGELDDDPVIFALRDRTSLAYGGVMITAFLAAAMGPWPW